MKKIIPLLAITLWLSTWLAAQPAMFNYQAVARNSTGNTLNNQSVGLRFTIHDSILAGNILYQETQVLITNQFGLFTTAIGAGVVVQGTLDSLNWAVNSKYLQVELDPTGGTNYNDMGTTQLLSVPYALYAAKAGGAPVTSAFRNVSFATLYGNQVTNIGPAGLGATCSLSGFTKVLDSTVVELDMNFTAQNLGTGQVATFQFQVDGGYTGIFTSAADIISDAYWHPVHLHALCYNLPAGYHTVSLFAYCSSPPGNTISNINTSPLGFAAEPVYTYEHY